jgi:hypothetical protein
MQRAFGGPVRVEKIPTNPYDSDVSTYATLQKLRRHAHNFADHPAVLNALTAACRAMPGSSSDRELAGAIFHFVRGTVTFCDDEALLFQVLGIPYDQLDKELLIVPAVLLAMPHPMGDCDDYSLLISSMALAAGLEPYYVTVAADPAQGYRKFSHIYVAIKLSDEVRPDGAPVFLALDAGNRMTGVPPGWESNEITRKAVWPV